MKKLAEKQILRKQLAEKIFLETSSNILIVATVGLFLVI